MKTVQCHWCHGLGYSETPSGSKIGCGDCHRTGRLPARSELEPLASRLYVAWTNNGPIRRSVYPRWVSLGKMTQDHADREIEVMSSIVDVFAKCASLERSGRDRPL